MTQRALITDYNLISDLFYNPEEYFLKKKKKVKTEQEIVGRGVKTLFLIEEFYIFGSYCQSG